MTLADVLSPLTITQFIEEYVGERHLVIKGTPGRFHDLVPWDTFNQALSRMRVNDRRVSLVQNSQPIARESYTHTSPKSGAQYLKGPAFRKHIESGATLVLNAADEVLPAVRQLAESCEDCFQIYVGANLYAGWRTDNGFTRHWDQHDTLIVQVYGRKSWQVWEPTRQHPLTDETEEVVPHPSADPIWQDTLEDGDVLYMPRGWWHVAYPCDELSLHITFGISHKTGFDLMKWALERVRSCVDVRRDVPHWRDGSERARWLTSLRAAFASALSEDVLDAYMRTLNDAAHTRPLVNIPKSFAAKQPLQDHVPLRLLEGRRLEIRPVNGGAVMAFSVKGTEWRCHPSLVPALSMLHHVTPCTLTDMSRKVDDRGRLLLRPFISALLMGNVIWSEAPQM